jgi:hypothetical protein
MNLNRKVASNIYYKYVRELFRREIKAAIEIFKKFAWKQ